MCKTDSLAIPRAHVGTYERGDNQLLGATMMQQELQNKQLTTPQRTPRRPVTVKRIAERSRQCKQNDNGLETTLTLDMPGYAV